MAAQYTPRLHPFTSEERPFGNVICQKDEWREDALCALCWNEILSSRTLPTIVYCPEPCAKQMLRIKEAFDTLSEKDRTVEKLTELCQTHISDPEAAMRAARCFTHEEPPNYGPN